MPLVNRTFDQLINFTRTTAATFVGSNGLIQSTPQSRNLLTFTEEFDNSNWTKTNVTIIPNQNPAAATLGSELVTNGDFASGSTGWTAAAGWSIGSGVATATATSTSLFGGQMTTVAGSVYRVDFDVVSYTSGDLIVTVGANYSGAVRLTSPPTGRRTVYVVGGTSTTRGVEFYGGTVTATIDNISVREVIGGALQAPDGTFTADTLIAAAGTGFTPRVADTSNPTTINAAAYTASMYVKAGTYTFFQIYLNNQSSEWANFTLTGAGTASANGSCTATITALSGGWYRCAMTYTAGGTDRRPFFMMAASGSATRAQTWNPAGTETVFIWGAQLEQVPDANLVLGSELRGSGVVSTTGSPSPLATYNTATGEATLNRVDGSNVSGVRIPVGGAGRAIRVSVTITATTGTVQVRGNGLAGTILGVVGSTAGTYLLYVVSDTADIYLTMSSNATTASITINSVREITGTTGMPSDYTRNFGGLFPPRFDYDPVTLAPRGLLIEEQRTNLLLRSEEFDNASWSKLRATVTANSTTAPDGTTTADTLLDTAVAGTHVAIQTTAKAASAITYAASVWLKADVRDQGELRVSDQAGNGVRCTFNLTTAAVGAAATFGTGFTAVSSQISQFANGWYRVVLVATSNTATTIGHEVYIANASGSISYTGTGAGFFVWGAQLEAGAFATSYIPTVASQVTRTADIAAIAAPNFASWYNQSEGTLVVEASTAQASNNRIVEMSGGTTSRVVDLLVVTSSGSQVQMYNGTANTTTPNALTLNQPFKTAGAYKTANYGVVLNGGTVAAATDALVNTANALQIGRFNAATNYLNGHIRSIRYYPVRLSNTQLQALTA